MAGTYHQRFATHGEAHGTAEATAVAHADVLLIQASLA